MTIFNPTTDTWFDSTLTRRWDEVEYRPCRNIPSGDDLETDRVEQCEPDEAEFWSVYLHDIEGGLYCVADVANEQQAKSLAALIMAAAKLYAPTDEQVYNQ